MLRNDKRSRLSITGRISTLKYMPDMEATHLDSFTVSDLQ
jgi:hypothetical protein